MESVNVPQFKDFVVSEYSYRVNEKLKDVETVSGICSDKININGELKIAGIDKYPCSTSQSIRLELPTGDEITIPASYHPWIKSDQDSLPVFTESEPELRWNEDLVTGAFYIMLNKFGVKGVILINCIYIDNIEYELCDSKYDPPNWTFYVEAVKHKVKIEDAKDYKFISLKDITC